MNITKFNEKFNRVDGNIYTVEEVVKPTGGVYEAPLIHDNANNINVYTGPKLTGNKINTVTFSTPSLTPWKTVIKIFSNISPLYISYETTGDQVEAEDINNLQDSINDTQKALNNEATRATNRENTIEINLNNEITRAKASEKTLTDNLSTEATRAKAAEKVLTDNLANETTRATNAEAILTNNLNTEINRAKAKENLIDTELANRYTKDKVYRKEEVLAKIEELIGTAPEVLDTFGEIATALGNDPNFATTMTTLLAGKVDKVVGKGLSTNDYTDIEKANLLDCNNKKHTHDNKTIIDKITQVMLDNISSAFTHITDSIKHITSAERTLWNTVSNKVDKITGKELSTNDFTSDYKNKVDGISSNANKVELSTTNGNIKIDGVEKTVYTHPTGTNPHGTNKSDVGLGNVDNTSDLNKPISIAAQAALNGKASTSHTHTKANITDFPTSLPANGGTASILGNATLVSDYNTLVPKTIASGAITPIRAENGANSPWGNTTSGFLIQSNSGDSFHILIFRSGGDGWAYRSNYKEVWGDWKIFSTNGHTHSKSEIRDMPTKLSQFTNDSGYITQLDVDTSQNHTHANKTVLDKITQALLDAWNGKADGVHTHDGILSKGRKPATDSPSTWNLGMYMTEVYNNGFPCSYGHCLTLKGSSSAITQICMEWKGSDATVGSMWIRNKRDSGVDAWSVWREFSFSEHVHDDRYYTESEIDSKVSSLNTSINGKANSSHTHDDRYYTESEVNTKLNTKVDKGMTWNELEGS